MQIVIVKEATPGTTPSTPTGETLRCTSFDGNISPTYQESKEIRTDRQRAPGSIGVVEATPTFGGEASYGSLDTLLDLLLGGGWSTENILKVGTSYVPSTCTLEHKDEGTAATKFQPYKGLAVSKLTISGGLGQNVEWSAEGPAMAVASASDTTLYSSITPANTNPVYGPANGQGSIKLNNVVEDGCTKWSITFDNSAQVNRACYNAGAHSVRQKGIKITASLDLYHEDQANYGRMTAGTEIPFQLTLGDGSTKSLQFDYARARVISVKCPETDGVRTETVELEMFVPTSGTDTACKITRKP